jgi:2-oxoglutarate-dependent dioxygenase
MATLPAIVRPRQLSEEELKTYQEQGYLLLPGLISREDAAQLRREVLEIMQIIGLEHTKLKQTHQYLEGGSLDTLINSLALRELAGQLMGGPATVFLPFTAVKSGGGGGRFHFHQDNQYNRFSTTGINMWFALQSMRIENGCLQMIPGSHLQGTLEWTYSGDGDSHRKIIWEPSPSDFVPLEMEPGDCVAFTRDTVHGSGQNLTDEPRIGYAVQYHRDDALTLREDGQWRSLKEFPKWDTRPVKQITPPDYDKLEGH